MKPPLPYNTAVRSVQLQVLSLTMHQKCHNYSDKMFVYFKSRQRVKVSVALPLATKVSVTQGHMTEGHFPSKVVISLWRGGGNWTSVQAIMMKKISKIGRVTCTYTH